MISTNTYTPLHIASETTATHVAVFSEGTGVYEVHCDANSTLTLLLIVHGSADVTCQIRTYGSNVTITTNVLCLGNAKTTTSCTTQTTLAHDSTSATMHMVTFLPEGSNCTINGNVTITPGIVQASGHLLEENIILGDKIQIKTLPMLDVQSNDVSASHGARIEKIDAKKLFYAQSRGLNESQAKGLIIAGYFDLLFGPILDSIQDMAEKGHLESLKHNYERVVVG